MGKGVRDASSVVPYDAGVRDDRLVTHLRAVVAQRALEPLRGARVANLAERGDRHLTDVRVVVFDGHEEPGKGLDANHVGQRDRGFGAHLGRRVAPQRLLEQGKRTRTRLMRAKRVSHHVADRGDPSRRLLRREVAKGGLEVARKRRRSEHPGLLIAR